jgi:hypothetical protein
MTLSTQHILSSEAALIGLLELLLGPLFVFIGVGVWCSLDDLGQGFALEECEWDLHLLRG